MRAFVITAFDNCPAQDDILMILSKELRGLVLCVEEVPYVSVDICAPELHKQLDDQGFRFCGYCGRSLATLKQK